MCELDGCKYASKFYVHVRTVPLPIIGPNGEDYGMESLNAARSLSVCSRHLPTVVRQLDALPIRLYGATPTVKPM